MRATAAEHRVAMLQSEMRLLNNEIGDAKEKKDTGASTSAGTVNGTLNSSGAVDSSHEESK